MRGKRLLLAIALTLAVAGAALAQTGNGYDLTWWTVDGGGGEVQGGGYTLTGTAGQPEPGPVLAGGDYALYSGFWSAASATPPACTAVTTVDLILVTAGDIYTDTTVQFSADIAPNHADKPYNYAVDYDDGDTATSTSSADPLTTPLDHTFNTVGNYDVLVKVWNCTMTEAEAKTDTVRVTVLTRADLDEHIFLPIVMKN